MKTKASKTDNPAEPTNAPSKPCAQISALDFEEQNFFTMGNDEGDSDGVASLSVRGNLTKTDSGFATGWGEKSATGKSAMSHPNFTN